MVNFIMAKRSSKLITNQQDIAYLCSLKQKDITMSCIYNLFGEFDGKIRFNQYDLFEVPANVYGPEGKQNKKPFTTTVGIWVFNVYCIEEELFKLFHYVNKTIDGDYLNDMIDLISQQVMEDKLPISALENFLQKTQHLMPITTPLTYASTEKIYGLSDYITPKKNALAKKYKEQLDAGDAVTAEKMEKELIEEAKKYLEDDPSMDIYNSKARSSIPNHLKNMYIMKGAVTNPDPTAEKKYDIILSNYNDGVSKEEYPTLCKSLATGPYSRARKTAIGGYWEKLFVMAYQHLVIGGPKTDCGTKQTLEVHLDKSNINSWMYSYIVDKGQLVELTSDNQDKYINKTVHLRFSALCESKNCICNKCAGNSFNRLGVTNVGVAMGMIASKIKNISMKAFHDGTVQTVEIDLKKAFGE